MQQQVINFGQVQTQPTETLIERVSKVSKRIRVWLKGNSTFYSKIAEFPVTRLLVLRINLVTLCLLGAAISIEQQPIVSLTAGACAGWLVYRLNHKGDK